jgi:hypothetical protein
MKNLLLRLPALLTIILFQSVSAKTVTTEKDDIVLVVTITEEDGKHVVTSELTNGSEYPICSSSLIYKQAFYVELKDAGGTVLSPFDAWAQDNAQKSSRWYKNPRSHMGFQLNPGDSVNFEFILEDAYPSNVIEQAVKMQVSWESVFGGSKNDLDGNPYHFPPIWVVAVSVPLSEIQVGLSLPQTDQAEIERETKSAEVNKIEIVSIDINNRKNYIIGVIISILVTLAIFAAFKKRKEHNKSEMATPRKPSD